MRRLSRVSMLLVSLLCACHACAAALEAPEQQQQQLSTAADTDAPAPATNYTLLFVPLSERTHMMVHLKLATELASRGHTVHMLVGDCLAEFARSTAAAMAPGVRLHLIPYALDCDRHDAEKHAARALGPLREAAAIYGNVVGRADDLLSDAALMATLAELAPRTDLMVSDVFAFGVLLALKLGVAHIDLDVGTAGALWEPAMYGAEAGAAFVPAVGTFLPTTGLSFWQRAANAAATLASQAAVRAAFWHPRAALQRVVDKHRVPRAWPYTKPLLLLVNSNFATEPPRSVPPNTQYVGPLLPEAVVPQHTSSLLPAPLEAFLAGAGPLGAVVVSFGGTLRPSLAASRTLLRVMRAMPDVRFVWRLGDDERAALAAAEAAADGSSNSTSDPAGSLPNVFVARWLPQNTLLAHGAVRAFVSQGGYLSMGEAAFHGVPVVGMPFIPGQGELIRCAEDQGRAVRLPAATLERGRAAAVVDALTAMLTQERFHAAAGRVAERLRAVKRPYVVQASDWVEYAAALKHHEAFLHPVAKLRLQWYQAAMLDVAALYLVLAGLLAWAVWRWAWWQSWRVAAALRQWQLLASGAGRGASADAQVLLLRPAGAAGSAADKKVA